MEDRSTVAFIQGAEKIQPGPLITHFIEALLGCRYEQRLNTVLGCRDVL